MLAPTPEKFKVEEKRIVDLWFAKDSPEDMRAFIEEHASEEYKAYCRETHEHLEEMERMGIMAG